VLSGDSQWLAIYGVGDQLFLVYNMQLCIYQLNAYIYNPTDATLQILYILFI